MSQPKETKPVILITGATSGIGRVCAEHLASRGWRVFGTGRRAVDAVTSDGVEMLPMDVDDEASVQNCVNEILARARRLDAVVNNAGFSMRGAAEDAPVAEAKALFETNFFGVLRVCRATLPALRANGGGCVINMSSVAGLVGVPFTGLYSASKFALEGLSESMRLELRPFGIHVVLVEPGDFKSEIDIKRRIIAPEGSAYQAAFNRFLARRAKYERASPAPEPVALLVERILASKNPKPRYMVGMPSQRLLVTARRFLPARIFEWIFARLLGL